MVQLSTLLLMSLIARETGTISYDASATSTLDGTAVTAGSSVPGTNWETDYSGDTQKIWIKADGSNSPIDALFGSQFNVVWTPSTTEDPSFTDARGLGYVELELTVESSINGSGTGYVKDESGSTLDSTIRSVGVWYTCDVINVLVPLKERGDETWRGGTHVPNYDIRATGTVQSNLRITITDAELYDPSIAMCNWMGLACSLPTDTVAAIKFFEKKAVQSIQQAYAFLSSPAKGRL